MFRITKNLHILIIIFLIVLYNYIIIKFSIISLLASPRGDLYILTSIFWWWVPQKRLTQMVNGIIKK